MQNSGKRSKITTANNPCYHNSFVSLSSVFNHKSGLNEGKDKKVYKLQGNRS